MHPIASVLRSKQNPLLQSSQHSQSSSPFGHWVGPPLTVVVVEVVDVVTGESHSILASHVCVAQLHVSDIKQQQFVEPQSDHGPFPLDEIGLYLHKFETHVPAAGHVPHVASLYPKLEQVFPQFGSVVVVDVVVVVAVTHVSSLIQL